MFGNIFGNLICASHGFRLYVGFLETSRSFSVRPKNFLPRSRLGQAEARQFPLRYNQGDFTVFIVYKYKAVPEWVSLYYTLIKICLRYNNHIKTHHSPIKQTANIKDALIGAARGAKKLS